MKLSRPVDYAMRACVDLSLQEGQLTDVRSIAERQGIPQHYLAKIVQQLAKAGIVSTNRGSRGGVRLSTAAEKLTLLRIMEAVEGPTSFSKCELWPGECSVSDHCPYHDMLAGLGDVVRQYMQSVTIASLASRVQPVPNLN